MYVTYCEPLSKIHFRLNNKGNITLKNVTLILAFDGSGLCIDSIFSLQEAYSFNGKDGGKLTITVSADNYPAKSYTVPVKLKK